MYRNELNHNLLRYYSLKMQKYLVPCTIHDYFIDIQSFTTVQDRVADMCKINLSCTYFSMITYRLISG